MRLLWAQLVFNGFLFAVSISLLLGGLSTLILALAAATLFNANTGSYIHSWSRPAAWSYILVQSSSCSLRVFYRTLVVCRDPLLDPLFNYIDASMDREVGATATCSLERLSYPSFSQRVEFSSSCGLNY